MSDRDPDARRRGSDAWRLLIMVAFGVLILRISTPIAVAMGEPSLAPWGMWTGLATLGAAASHVLRRLFFPRIDLQRVMIYACQHGQAGHVALGICIVLAALVLTMGSARAGELPERAALYLPVLVEQQHQLWPDAPDVATLAGQIEQETCPNLKHPKCWNPRAELRTQRERGVGLGQITRTARFDALAEQRAAHPGVLGRWSWDDESLFDPRLQIDSLILQDRAGWDRITDTLTIDDRLAMMLVSYNAGLGRVISDRKVCAVSPGCDPRRWWDNVEHTSNISRRQVSGYGQSFFSISRAYPRRIIRERRARYAEAVSRT